jgi:NADP-dependent 3-hydroxy acid dehydrogenase YdfG
MLDKKSCLESINSLPPVLSKIDVLINDAVENALWFDSIQNGGLDAMIDINVKDHMFLKTQSGK